MKKLFILAVGVLGVSLIPLLLFVYCNTRDAHPGYSQDLHITGKDSVKFQAGFSAKKITPAVEDTWTDSNGNAKFDKGESYHDHNGNGKFDAWWIAGFHNRRPANGIHDDLWARTVFIDDGTTRIAIVSVDVIGMGYNHTIDIRKEIPQDLGIDYAVICNTHNHEAPDVIGMWGKGIFKPGVNKKWLAFVKEQAVASIAEAAAQARPARFRFAEDLTSAIHLVNDTRPPFVLDPGLYVMEAVDAETGKTLGTVVNWGNHPETLWSKNVMITSDFPHYVREGMEKGVFVDGKEVKAGRGGICVYLTGSVGGLMTTNDRFAFTSALDSAEYLTADFKKAEMQGMELAYHALTALEKSSETENPSGISIHARSFEIPLKNRLFKLGVALGVLDRGGFTSRGKFRTEVGALRFSEVQMLLIPGEIYPELVNGGVENPEGSDYGIDPLEIPPLREAMTSRYKWVLGLANDEIGYILPKSQWDTKAPFTYGRDKAPYGEENSCGPETGPAIHGKALELLNLQNK
ncbi:MAG: hypothetical protein LRY55_14860 [Leadbetterella sp.]|nr:hypothetical protein [Leadbetterella sp.]